MKIVFVCPFPRNYRAGFLYPLVRFRRELEKRDISIRLACDLAGSFREETIIISSEWLQSKGIDESEFEATCELLGQLRKRCERLWFFDMTDGPGTIYSHVLPLVDRYLKAWVLRDSSMYKRQHYQSRVFTDFYHRHFGINDKEDMNYPPVPGKDIHKIRLAWNYSLYTFGRGLKIWDCLPLMLKTRIHSKFSFNENRAQDVTMRIGLKYELDTVRFHRQLAIDFVKGYGLSASKISKRKFFQEMQNSKVSISPFGWGEICLRDYESFISGTALVKPSIRHMVTFPNVFLENRTFAEYDWHGNNLKSTIDKLLSDGSWREMARIGQETYIKSVFGLEAQASFCDQIQEVFGI